MTMALFDAKARGRVCAALALAFFCSAAPATAQPAADASASAKTSAKLTGVVLAMPAGTRYMNAKDGLWCLTPIGSQTANGAREALALAPYTTIFKQEIESAGYQVVAAEDNLFGQEDGASDYQVAAVVTDLSLNMCIYTTGGYGIVAGDARGDGSMTIEWQVYSPLKKEVVARITTNGTAKLERSVAGVATRLTLDAFTSNVRALAAKPEFRTAMNAARPARDEILAPAKNDPIALSGSLAAPKRSISDSVGSVVTLLTGSGSGSGALVSDDGYIITDAHVVGDEKHIRARWPDGIETVADVIRVAKDRDIALVKTNPRDRSPLPIRRGALTPGQRVFAIGSPNGQKFQGTVSSGVVSATRTFNGLRYIQSDVSVSFGSSGGPLLDADGAVIGFTDLGIQNEGQPAGLNLFTPIGDAMDFLNLEQK
jgi:serine protease Do